MFETTKRFMEKLTYSLAIQELAIFSRESADITALFHNFFAPGSKNYQQLTYELQREFKQGGSPEVTAIMFDRVKYDASTGKGSFRIVLDINFTFGCEDVKTESGVKLLNGHSLLTISRIPLTFIVRLMPKAAQRRMSFDIIFIFEALTYILTFNQL